MPNSNNCNSKIGKPKEVTGNNVVHSEKYLTKKKVSKRNNTETQEYLVSCDQTPFNEMNGSEESQCAKNEATIEKQRLRNRLNSRRKRARDQERLGEFAAKKRRLTMRNQRLSTENKNIKKIVRSIRTDRPFIQQRQLRSSLQTIAPESLSTLAAQTHLQGNISIPNVCLLNGNIHNSHGLVDNASHLRPFLQNIVVQPSFQPNSFGFAQPHHQLQLLPTVGGVPILGNALSLNGLLGRGVQAESLHRTIPNAVVDQYRLLSAATANLPAQVVFHNAGSASNGASALLHGISNPISLATNPNFVAHHNMQTLPFTGIERVVNATAGLGNNLSNPAINLITGLQLRELSSALNTSAPSSISNHQRNNQRVLRELDILIRNASREVHTMKKDEGSNSSENLSMDEAPTSSGIETVKSRDSFSESGTSSARKAPTSNSDLAREAPTSMAMPITIPSCKL